VSQSIDDVSSRIIRQTRCCRRGIAGWDGRSSGTWSSCMRRHNDVDDDDDVHQTTDQCLSLWLTDVKRVRATACKICLLAASYSNARRTLINATHSVYSKVDDTRSRNRRWRQTPILQFITSILPRIVSLCHCYRNYVSSSICPSVRPSVCLSVYHALLSCKKGFHRR